MNLMKNVRVSLLVIGLLTGIGSVSFFSQSSEEKSGVNVDFNETASYGMGIARGTYTGTEFFAEYKLSSSNGENVNYSVNNTGKVAVKITINGAYAATIQPGMEGHITVPIGSFNKKYEFKAVPTPNGGQISITYEIAQSDAQIE